MNGTTTTKTKTKTTTSSGPLEESGEYQKVGGWTKEEDEALGRGRLKHGTDWEKIHAIVNETGEGRTLAVVKQRKSNFKKKSSDRLLLAHGVRGRMNGFR